MKKQEKFYKVGISILFGILTFVLSRYVMVIDTVYNVKINCALILPVLIAQAWGIRYALLTSVAGAGLSPFITDPARGVANILFVILYLLYIIVNGYYHNQNTRNGFCGRSLWGNGLYCMFYYLAAILLTPAFLYFNHFFKNPEGIILNKYISPAILQIQTINYVLGLICISMFARVLIMLPWIRQFFLLRILPHSRLIIKTYFVVCICMISFVIFDSVLDSFYVRTRGFRMSIFMRNTGGLTRLPLFLAVTLFICYSCMYHITEEEDSKENIRYREEQYHKIFENIIDVYLEIDEEGKIINCSPSFFRTFEYSPEYVIGGSLSQILLEPGETDNVLKQLFSEEEITNYELWGITGRKQKIPLLLEGKVICNHFEQKIGIVMIRNIRMLRETEAKMKYFSANLNSVIEANRDYIWIVDGETFSFILSNSQFKELLREKYDFNVETGDFVNKIELFEGKTDLDRLCTKAMENGPYTVEIKLTAGTVYEVSFYPIKVSETETNLAVFARDTTEQKMAENEIRKLNENLKQLVEERTQKLKQAYSDLESYSYTVSHELKTPIREIDTYVDIIQEDTRGQIGAETQKDMCDIREICKKTIDMIEKMMQYAKIGYSVMRSEQIDMQKLVSECVAELEIHAHTENVHLRMFEMESFYGDHFLMKQAVFNVLSNSLKFSKSRETVYLTVGQMKNSEKQIYYFADNGVGFSEDKRSEKKVFELFDRMHTQEEYEGSGVGLATVKKVVEMHNGIVKILGELNKGCVVVFEFSRSPVSPK